MSRLSLRPARRNVLMLAVLSFLQALQLLIWAAAASSLIPYPRTDFVTKIFPVYLPEVRPEREMLLFRLFVVMAVAIMAAWIVRYKEEIDSRELRREYGAYTVFTAAGIVIQLIFVFKLIVFGGALWARVMMWLCMVGALFAHVFWPELQRILSSWQGKIISSEDIRSPHLWDASFILLLFVLLYPNNLDNVLGRMFVHDQFYHLDSMLMMPGFAHVKGLLLNRDITSEYSAGLPIILSNVLQFFHGFDYPGAVRLLIILSLVYYAALYLFIVRWLNSRPLGVLGTLLAVKWQMFHWGVAPLVWQFPSATALRHLPDIVFYFTFWQYLRTLKTRWLITAVISVGVALFWMMDVGLYLLAALCAGMLLFNWRQAFAAAALALGTAFVLLWAVQPQAVVSADYWKNQFEFASLFLNGWGALPMTEGLKDKQFFAFIMGFVIPVGYAASLMYSAQHFWADKRRKDHLFVVVLCLYGLGLYHYFIHRSGVTSYYAVCVPLVLLVCFWGQRLLARLPADKRRLVAIMAASLMLPILLTSYLFTYYPNILNLAGNDWKIEAKYYREHFDLKKDAQMIASLSAPGERVAIISSFETRILMQADRPPLFYYSPMVESSLMDDPRSRLTYLHTYKRLRETIAQLEERRPSYVFIEAKMLNVQGQEALTGLLSAVMNNYTPFKQGVYLIAFKRTK